MLNPRIPEELALAGLATIATVGTLTYAALSPDSQLFGRTPRHSRPPRNARDLLYDRPLRPAAP
jgi:hypothetical protein